MLPICSITKPPTACLKACYTSQPAAPSNSKPGPEGHLEPPTTAYNPSGLHRRNRIATYTHTRQSQRRKVERKRAELLHPATCNKTEPASIQDAEIQEQHPDDRNRHTISRDAEVIQPEGQLNDVHETRQEGSKRAQRGICVVNVTSKRDEDTNRHPFCGGSDCAGQCLFVCLEQGPMDHYAIEIRCSCPSGNDYGCTDFNMELSQAKEGTEEYRRMRLREIARKWNSDVLDKTLEKCYSFIGWWKTFIPFYGIISLRVVQFDFKGTVDQRGNTPVFIHERDVKEVQEIINEEEATREEAYAWSQNDFGGCRGGFGHTDQCDGWMEVGPNDCCADEAVNANRSSKAWQVFQSVFKMSARQSLISDEDLCIAFKRQHCLYDLGLGITTPKHGQFYDGDDEFRGIQVKFGWQF